MHMLTKWTRFGIGLLMALGLACGGVEESPAPLDPGTSTVTEFETSDEGLKPGGGGGSGLSCSASGAWCFDHRDNHWDIDNGCSITCPNGGAACDDAFCGGFDGTVLFGSVCVCRRTSVVIF